MSGSRLGKVVVLVLLTVALVLVSSPYLPLGRDWGGNYRRASLVLLSGETPYTVEPFFAPPWSLLPLLPFAILPLDLGRAALFWVSMIAFAFSAYRLGAKPSGVGLFLLSPPVIHSLLNANIEWMPLLGFVLPPQVGLLLVSTKPQTGFVVAFFWLIEAWRVGGVREVCRIAWPLAITTLLSFVLFGLWPARFRDVLPIATDFNASLWPYTLPIGLALAVASIHRREIRFAMAASPCLSPYVLFHTWSAAVLATVPATLELGAVVAGLWALVVIRAFGGGL